MPSVTLEMPEWNEIMRILATKVTWAEANPLLMKIGSQLQQTQNGAPPMPVPEGTDLEKTNSHKGRRT